MSVRVYIQYVCTVQYVAHIHTAYFKFKQRHRRSPKDIPVPAVMFSPLPSSRTSPGSAGARGASPATRPVVRPRSRAAGASATLSPSVRAGSDRLHPPQMPDSPIPRPAPRGVKPEVSVAIRVHSPPQLEAETTAVIDNHFSCEVLRTALRQSAFSRRQLQATAAAESEKAERDLLRLWQLVFDVEEEEAALSDKHAALSEVVKTHGALAALVSAACFSDVMSAPC